MDKNKVILMQLPFPEFAITKNWGNIPLGSAYLKAIANKHGLLEYFDIEILSQTFANTATDSIILDYIYKQKPKIVGFTTGSWNSYRNLYLAEKIKRKLPDTLIIIGGPEVTPDTNYILNNIFIDWGCFYEGELNFVVFLQMICNNNYDFRNISGSFCRYNKTLHINKEKNYIQNLDEIPSPFQLGYLNLKREQIIAYETMRGCPFNCAYCNTGNIPWRNFSADRVIKDLEILIKQGINSIRFVGSNFLRHPQFKEICEALKEINKEKKSSLGIFTYAENLNEKNVSIMLKSNILEFEVGLQSVNEQTLKNVKRKALNKEKFVKGIELLNKFNMKYSVDVICGLPTESYDDIKKTISFLEQNNIKNYDIYLLQILPGTSLQKLASHFNIYYESKPPYNISHTDYLSSDEIKRLLSMNSQHEDIFFNNYDFYAKIENFQNNLLLKQNENIKYNIVVIDDIVIGEQKIEKVYQNIKNRIQIPFSLKINISSINYTQYIRVIEKIISKNPFIVCSIIIEFKTDSLIYTHEKFYDLVETIRQKFPYAKLRTVFIFNANYLNLNKFQLNIKKSDEIILKCSLTNTNSQDLLRTIQKSRYKKILIDLKLTRNDVYKLLNFVYEFLYKKDVVFENIILKYLYELIKIRTKDMKIISPLKIANIGFMNKKYKFETKLIDSEIVKFEIVKAQMIFLKDLKKNL